MLVDVFDRGLGGRLVEDDLAARHRDHAVAGLEHVLHVVRDEDAGDPLTSASGERRCRSTSAMACTLSCRIRS